MSMNRRTRTAGAAVIEFTLVGIPLIFVLISTFEMARGMWMYHSLADAVKEGSRYASVHGQNCGVSPNNCLVTIGLIATKIANASPGLSATGSNNKSLVSLTFTDAGGTATTCNLTDCMTSSTRWPPATKSAAGLKVRISGTYAFSSVICMLWPGAAGGPYGPSGTVNLSAYSIDSIQF